MILDGYNSVRSWVALAACACISFFIALPMRLAGLFFVIVLDGYHTDRKLASTPIVIFGVIRSFTGPFIGYLGDALGYRAVTMTGCIFGAVGIGACYFAQDITGVIISLGIFYGIGLACGNTLMPTILKLHFNENVNLVNGVYLTGSCIGAVVMSPVIQYLIKVYGESGMFLILGGIFLNCIPAAYLLKNPHNERKIIKDISNHDVSMNMCHVNLAFVSDDEKLSIENQAKETTIMCEISHGNCKAKIAEKKLKEIEDTCNNEILNSKNDVNLKGDNNSMKEDKNNEIFQYKIRNEGKQTEFSNFTNITLTRFSETQSSLKIAKGSENLSNYGSNLNDSNQNCKVQVLDEKLSKHKAKRNKLSCHSFLLFADPTFHCIMLVQSVHAFITTLNWTILIDFARDKGIPDDESVYYVMFLPVSEMFGNLCFNWITDRNFITRTNYSVICFIVLIFNAVFILWAWNFALMLIAVLIFGCVSGCVQTTFPGIIMEFIPEDKQNMALASRYILYAFMCITKSPLIGFFRGRMGSYSWIYYIIIICLSVSAILCKLTPVVASCLEKRRKAKESG